MRRDVFLLRLNILFLEITRNDLEIMTYILYLVYVGNIGSVSGGFHRRWSYIPKRCSLQLMSLCLSWDQRKLGQTESDIISLDSSLQLEITPTEFQEASRIITIYNTPLTTDLEMVQKKEVQRNAIHDRNKTRSRRFKHWKTITINDKNTTDICPVLNVSSVTFENSGTSLLSKGLDFKIQTGYDKIHVLSAQYRENH